MLDFHSELQTIVRSRSNVLLLGETGSGKELAAQTIYRLLRHRHGPLVTRHLGEIPDTAAEPEIFGYEPNSALAESDRAGKPGCIELAHNGTLFLDELQSVSTVVQDKLLRVSQTGEVWRYGARQPLTVDVHIVAATSEANVGSAIERGKIQPAFIYRFQPLVLPPLRERREDVRLLAFCFLDRYAAKLHTPARTISRRALHALSNRTWRGNVRELERQIERAVARGGDVLFSWDFDEENPPSPDPTKGTRQDEIKSIREGERATIVEALEANHGNLSRTAKQLVIVRNTLLKKMKKYGIPRGYGVPNRRAADRSGDLIRAPSSDP
jgi:transcriptional regulator with PAS, ATPase and Fis domain